MPVLLSDIISWVNPKVTYGYKEDQVTVVADHDGVLIVENLNGNRFSVNAKMVGDAVITGQITPVPEPKKQLVTVRPPSIRKSSSSKAVPKESSQTNLF